MTTPASAPASGLSKESYLKTLASRVASGDAAALAILTEPKAQALGFASLLQSIATRGKTTLQAILPQVDSDTLDWLLRALPKDSPQRGLIQTAARAARAAAPPEITYYAPGQTTVGFSSNKKPSEVPMISLTAAGPDGKRITEKHALPWWRWFLSLADSPETIAQLRSLTENH